MKKSLIALAVLGGFFIGVTTLSAIAQVGGCTTPPGSGWAGPGNNTPPNANVCPPINTGNTWQFKAANGGGLGLGPNAIASLDRVLHVTGGAFINILGAGSITTDKFQLLNGRGDKKVLKSDAEGNATWVDWTDLTGGNSGLTDWVTIDSGGTFSFDGGDDERGVVKYPINSWDPANLRSVENMCVRAGKKFPTGACMYTFQDKTYYSTIIESNQLPGYWTFSCNAGPAGKLAFATVDAKILCTK